MRTMTIRFKNVSDLSRLLDILNTVTVPCSMVQDHIVVEAKSLLGVASLNFGRPMKLVINGDISDEVYDKLKTFLAFAVV